MPTLSRHRLGRLKEEIDLNATQAKFFAKLFGGVPTIRRFRRRHRRHHPLQGVAVLLSDPGDRFSQHHRVEEAGRPALLAILQVGGVPDVAEPRQGQDVPFPPREAPDPGKDHRHHRLSQQNEGGDQRQGHRRRSVAIELEVAVGAPNEEHDGDNRQPNEPRAG